VDTQLQRAVDAWADEQNEAVNSASEAADACAPPTPALAPHSARLTCICLVELQPRRGGPHHVYCVVRPRFGPPKDAGMERKQLMRRLNREWGFQRAEACRAPTGPSSSSVANKAKWERSAPRSPGGRLVAVVGSTASRAKAAVNDAISSVVARTKIRSKIRSKTLEERLRNASETAETLRTPRKCDQAHHTGAMDHHGQSHHQRSAISASTGLHWTGCPGAWRAFSAL
jgi:hypothetical protein